MDYKLKLIIRLTLAVIIGINFNIFYKIFSPLTLYGTILIMKLLGFTPILTNNILTINNNNYTFVPACTAAVAYLLLTYLILLTKDIKLKTSILIWLFGSSLILIVNLLRIIILILIDNYLGYNWFNLLHLFFWKVIATFLVVIIWIILTNKFKIKTIPIYSDIRYLLKEIKKS